MYTTPILFLVFNRTDTTEKVFEAIKKLRPAFLYVAADGPRKNKEGEAAKCAAVRAIIDNGINWPCTIKKLYRTNNLGCGVAVSEAISWFFEHEEKGIILEDDTLPNESFFSFCAEMLELYKHDEAIMHISGSNYAHTNIKETHYFTRLPFIWGWATWRRAWEHYDFSLKYASSQRKKNILTEAFANNTIIEYWEHILNDFALTPKSYTWDFQWFLSLWQEKGLVIQPSKNLVMNIGFGEDATHTSSPDHHLAKFIYLDFASNVSFTKKSNNSIEEKLQDENFFLYFRNLKQTPIRKGLSFLLKPLHIKIKFKKFIEKYLLKRLADSINKLEFEQQTFPDGCFINSESNVSKRAKLYNKYQIYFSSIDDFTYVAANSYMSHVNIGKFCSIGSNFMAGYGIHPINGISTSPMFYSTRKQNGYTLSGVDKIVERKEIFIGNDVFIGMNVTILDGVSIGDGAVVAAGSVVNKDVPPYAVVGGVPAKIIKYRFANDEIAELLNIQWWNFSIEKLQDVESDFFDIPSFIQKHKK